MILSSGDIVAILIGLIGAGFGLAAFFRAHPNATPAQVDTAAAERIDALHQNRDYMERLERAYQASNEANRRALDLSVSVLRFIAPLTPGIKTDDAAAGFLSDIQTPGEETPTGMADKSNPPPI